MECRNFHKLMEGATEYDTYFTVTKENFGNFDLRFNQDKCKNNYLKDVFVINDENTRIARKLKDEITWVNLENTGYTTNIGGRKSRRHKKRKTKMRRYKHRKSRRTRR